MRSISLDLEMMSTAPDAAICAIGMVEFHHDDDVIDGNGVVGPRIDRTFYRPVHLATSVKAGGRMDASTVLWWLEQDIEVIRKTFWSAIPIEVALAQANEFMMEAGGGKEILVYSRGALDSIILRTAMERSGIAPWCEYYSDRDTRTMRKLYPLIPEPEFEGMKHYALDDAMHEAKLVWNLHYQLNGRGKPA